MRIRDALTRHLPQTARFGAIGAILATRLAVAPLVGDATSGPATVTPDSLATGAAAVAQVAPQHAAPQHAVPSAAQLTPLPVTAQQSHIPLSDEQVKNAEQ